MVCSETRKEGVPVSDFYHFNRLRPPTDLPILKSIVSQLQSFIKDTNHFKSLCTCIPHDKGNQNCMQGI